MVVNTGSQYDIGFHRKAEEYEVVADWWGVEGNTLIRQQPFIQQVNRQYAYNLIHDQAREQNLIVEEEQTLENGDVVIILPRGTRRRRGISTRRIRRLSHEKNENHPAQRRYPEGRSPRCRGPECVQFTQELEQRLGTPLGEREFKPEYHETESETERQHEVDR